MTRDAPTPHTLPPGHHDVLFVEIHNLRDAGGIARFHTEPKIPPQTVGQHSFNMAIMAHLLWPDDWQLQHQCLVHDVGEQGPGDIPATAKWRWPRLAYQCGLAEREVRDGMGIGVHLTSIQHAKLKFLDRLELCWYCAELVVQGNRYAREIYNKVMTQIIDHAGEYNPDQARLVDALQRFMEN